MPTPVFTWKPTYTFQHTITRELIINEYGDGYCQTMSSEVAYSRSDGSGVVSAHKGLHLFAVNFNNTHKTKANAIWSFLLERLNLLNEPFYFYNPEEIDTPDPTGNNTTGRYLVRLKDPNQVLSRSYLKACFYGFSSLELVETRSL